MKLMYTDDYKMKNMETDEIDVIQALCNQAIGELIESEQSFNHNEYLSCKKHIQNAYRILNGATSFLQTI